MQYLTAEQLARERVYLLGIAYRMLGSASDAEDVVQEALVRGAGAGELRSPRAFLTTVVTRLCLDELGSARRRRETYVGPFLPEPVPTAVLDDPGERRDDVSLALLLVLDRLSPLERAVFVLRDVFELPFSDIAEALGRSETACRKLLSRARDHIAAAEPRNPAPPAVQHAIANAFFTAVASGDLKALVQLLADEVSLQTDHGGKASAARRSLRGSGVVARFVLGLAQKGARAAQQYRVRPCELNGAPAFVLYDASNEVRATFTLEITEASEPHIAAVHVVRNPDKLRALTRALRRGLRLARPSRQQGAGALESNAHYPLRPLR